MENFTTINNTPLWPCKKQCTATSKQTGNRCGNWAAKGFNVCRFHGAGGGPKTKNGKKIIKRLRTTHGKYSLQARKTRLVKRLENAMLTLGIFKGWYIKLLMKRILQMQFSEFEKCEPFCRAFIKGTLDYWDFLSELDGKIYKQNDFTMKFILKKT